MSEMSSKRMHDATERSIRIAHVATIDLSLRVLLLPQLLRLRDEGYAVSAISAPGPSVEYLRDRGIQHVPWTNATRAWDPAGDARAFGELVQILRAGRFHLVHTHNAKPGVMGRMAARAVGVPCVINTVHGFDARPDDRLVKRAAFMGLEWFAARFSDLELYQSSADLIRARRLAMKRRSKSVLLGNGIDLARFDPARVAPGRLDDLRRELGIEADAVVVGSVGRLVADKGFRELFRAAGEVRRALPNAVFVVIGDRDSGKADAITESEIEAVRPGFVFTGWREDMAELYALMDLFVLPSWREGFPRSPMEAAAMEKALILSDIPGCHEIGRDGVEALFVRPRDPSSLARAILGLLRDPDRRSRMGAAARATAVSRFDEQRVAETVSVATRRVLSSRGLALPSLAKGSLA
jgi:glycosyltransferase involved in cell wall biosynthesis